MYLVMYHKFGNKFYDFLPRIVIKLCNVYQKIVHISN